VGLLSAINLPKHFDDERVILINAKRLEQVRAQNNGINVMRDIPNIEWFILDHLRQIFEG
jgi:hypothetical protein